MPTDTQRERFKRQQIAAAVALGINPLDALNAVNALLALVPMGVDLATYIVPSAQLVQDVSEPKYASDALAAWVGNDEIPSRFKLLLAAGSA